MRLAGLTIALLLLLASAARAAECTNLDALKVPGAERQENACLDDLTTAGTSQNGHTDASDWETLHAQETVNPTGVPGIQVDGYFPDTSTTNGTHGWNHDAQFVMRFPDKWNGKLVISGAPGVRKQYSPDYIISDWVLSRGYAYASTDKGNTGTSFQNDGQAPADAIAEWHMRVTELTVAMKAVVQQRYGRAPARTYITGISNGGYLTRWQLENRPDLFDGGVDWEGTLFRPEGPNLFTYLPVALAHYRQWRATQSAADHDAMIAAGFEPGSEVVWDHHYGVYWDLTQRTYREELDPGYDGALNAGAPFCTPGTPMCDADYDYFSRPPEVRAAVARVSLNGAIGKPLLTLHGTLDALLPIRTDSDVYARLVQGAGKGELHRYYTVEGGNHVDGLYDAFKDQLRPILPCQRTAFLALERWVEAGDPPPDTQFVPRPASGDIVNECPLKPSSGRPGGGNPTAPATTGGSGGAGGRIAPAGLTATIRPGRDRRRPYRFAVTGRLVLPTGADPRRACAGGGYVSAVVRHRRRPVAVRAAKLRRDCGYSLRLTFRRRPAKRLSVAIRFRGNRQVGPAAATARTLRLG